VSGIPIAALEYVIPIVIRIESERQVPGYYNLLLGNICANVNSRTDFTPGIERRVKAPFPRIKEILVSCVYIIFLINTLRVILLSKDPLKVPYLPHILEMSKKTLFLWMDDNF
jgi:hypothetical protein